MVAEKDEVTDIALIEQDKSTVKILQEDDLKSVTETMKKVALFKRNYTVKKLAVTDIDNKEQKEKLRVAMADLRKTRVDLEKVRKEKIKPYQETIAFVNGNYNKAIEIIETMELPLKEIKTNVEERIEARENEERLALEAQVNARIAQIISGGAIFDGAYYSIGSDEFNVPAISLGIIDFQTMTNETFEIVLSKVIEGASTIKEETEKKLAAEKLAAELKLAEQIAEREKFNLEQAALKAEVEAFKKEREEMETMRKELQAEKDRIEDNKLAEQVRLSNEAAKKETEKRNDRYGQLLSLGMVYNGKYGCYAYEDINVDNATEICLLTDKEWDVLVQKISNLISEKKILQKKADDDKKIEDDKAIAAKAIEDKRIADELIESQRIQALSAAKDATKYADVIKQLMSVSFPEMATKKYQLKVDIIKDFISDLN